MDKVFTFQIDEQPVEITGKQSKVLKLFAVIVAVVVIWLLILTGFVYVTYQPENCVQPLTQNAPKNDQDFSLSQNTADQATLLIFNFRNTLSKSTLSNGNFTCSIQNSEHPCSNSFQKWNNFTKSALQIQFLESAQISSVFYLGQLTFDHNNNVIYKVREKYGFHSTFDGNKAETVFKSNDFDWNQKVSFGPEKKTINVNQSFVNELDKIKYPCPIGQLETSYLCYTHQPSIKTMTNLFKAVFPIKVFNLTWAIGIASDFHMIVSEYAMIGKLQNHTTPQYINSRIGLFDQELTALCDCLQRPNHSTTYCSNFGSIQFRAVLDKSLCPSELQKRINLHY